MLFKVVPAPSPQPIQSHLYIYIYIYIYLYIYIYSILFATDLGQPHEIEKFVNSVFQLILSKIHPFWNSSIIQKVRHMVIFYSSRFLGCLTCIWSFKTVSLWKVALFLTQRPWALCCRQKVTRSCKISRLCPHWSGCRCHFSYFLSSRNPLETFLIACSQKHQWNVRRIFNAVCSKSPVGRWQAFYFWTKGTYFEGFLFGPFSLLPHEHF